MAESTSERSPRAASASSRSRYTRFAVRGLVVAGLAGAAWLLSSSAAHASDSAARDAVTGAAAPSGADGGGLFGLLGGALPEAAGGPGLLESPVLQPIFGTAAVDPVSTVVPPVSGVVEPVGAVVRQVHGSVDHVVNANATGRAVKASPVVPVSRSRSTGATVSSGFTRTTAMATKTATTDVPVAAAVAATTGHAGTATDGLVQRGAGSRHRDPSGDRPAEAGTRTDVRRTSHVPLLPRPAPAPAVPGGGMTSGVPSLGAGLNQDGGAPAIAPALPVAATATTGRPEAADDVAVRPLIAESPTVSPD
jgi:hypothetical protein